MSNANVGKTVTWTKHKTLGRPNETRTGVIVAFVPVGKSLHNECCVVTGKSYSEVDACDIAQIDRYLVREDRKDKKGRDLKSKFYAPYASIIDGALLDAKLAAAKTE